MKDSTAKPKGTCVLTIDGRSSSIKFANFDPGDIVPQLSAAAGVRRFQN